MSTHRAIVRTGDTVTVATVPTPVPGPGEMVIAPRYAGLCGTDIQMLRGLRDDPAPIIGHEGIARVVATGDGVPASLRPGTLVAVNPTHPGDPGFLLGHNVAGLLQERTLLPATAVAGGMVVVLPESTDVTLGPLLEPLAVVRYALSQLRAAHPETLLIIGDGTVGHLAARAAARWLGERTRVVLVHHTEAGRRFSVGGPYPPGSSLVAGELAAALPGPVAVLLATPRDATVAALEAALAVTGPGTLIDVVGGLPPGARTALLPGVDLTAVRAANCGGRPDPALVTTTSGGVRLLGHRGVSNEHLRAAAGELARDPERYRDLITHRTDLDGAARIMTALRTGRNRIIDGHRLVKLSIEIDIRKDLR
ncbi:alcohol dehydrogenase catalytic domain-containing protein [Actinoplanes sp. NEAU-A12]|uniref:Alcohol dehydrogenase catalytic domain-containing protein n=1 Tax=Actinoplanes sandaracinus TaxID=3045177 RepID=A0ABT6WGR6_9ACTN|nr:alcohol dehydrogenase catalytic domain-containing protein [Actinoplanes sandaracinus]MDI6098927.1 alcohol dehydrogenase catalytic domain-containing protein [Actinoplanes sandaracinus]